MPIAEPEAPLKHAPGAPGISPSWTSSAKDMVGTSLGPARLWFTLGFGIVNEVYYPRVDTPQIRDLGFIVAGPGGFWSEVKRNQDYTLRLLAPGVPAVEIVHQHDRYTLRLRITPDPRRDVLAIECRLDGEDDLRLYVLLAPHLGATGYDNLASVERYAGRRVLLAEQGPFGCALAAVDQHQADAMGRASAGYVGAMVASLSVPWGYAGNQRGGYHLVWPRDLVHCAGALLAFGAEPEARDTLRYLIATQTEDGHWYQNQWLGGTPYWTGIQLDEAAMPVLLAQELEERDALGGIAVEDMVRRALGYIARTGPSTAQDRWEENEGINAYTLATLIAAMVAGAALLPAREAEWALALADFWNANIEAWLAVHGTELGRRYDVPGYYLRVAPPSVLADAGASHAIVPIRNRRDSDMLLGDEQIGTEFLHLVRVGLRRADDPLIMGSLRLADAPLKTDTAAGPGMHRYRRGRYRR